MSKSMTPSEIAEELERATIFNPNSLLSEAAATIRDCEATVWKHIESHQETLDRERVALDKLKIATEALEEIGGAEFYETTCTTALNAIARIKEAS